MTKKRIHFPLTTAQQRKLLFETWEETGNVTQACRKAHVGRGTFYYWKPRFDEQGYAGLEEFSSRAPKRAKADTARSRAKGDKHEARESELGEGLPPNVQPLAAGRQS